MTANVKAEGKAGATPRDRYAELLVIIVVIAALILAWGVKAGAEARAVHIEVEGFKASYGYNWHRETATSPYILAISDPASGARFHTTITVQKLTNAGSNEVIARSLNQARLQDWELYRALKEESIQWRGQQAYRNTFAYVYVSPDLLNPEVPVVLHGVDHIFQYGSNTYIITCQADESVYDKAMVQFERFLASVTPD